MCNCVFKIHLIVLLVLSFILSWRQFSERQQTKQIFFFTTFSGLWNLNMHFLLCPVFGEVFGALSNWICFGVQQSVSQTLHQLCLPMFCHLVPIVVQRQLTFFHSFSTCCHHNDSTNSDNCNSCSYDNHNNKPQRYCDNPCSRSESFAKGPQSK